MSRAGRSRVLAVAATVVALGVAGVWGVSQLRPESSPQAPKAAASPSPSPARSMAVTRSHFVAHPQPVPILVYHHVLPAELGPQLLYVSPKQFAEELAYLKRHHYQAVTLRQVYNAWIGKGSLPAHPIVISFDDGYVDQMRRAAPRLRRYHWPAELDLILDTLYQGPHAPSTRVTTAMVRKLLDEGWELESHTVSHRNLTLLSARDLRRELVYSRRRLQEIFKAPVDFLCYPGGEQNARVRRAVHRAGYLAATGTAFAVATPRQLYALPRIYCYWGESLPVFARRLRVTMAAARRAGR